MKTVTIRIEGMFSLTCAIQLQRALSAVPTVKGLAVTIGGETVEHENASDEQLLKAICAAGNYRGEIMTVPGTRIISKLKVRVRKVYKVTAPKKLWDTTILASSDLPPSRPLPT